MATITITRNKTLPNSSDKSDFHDLVDTASATISGIEQSDLGAGIGTVVRQAIAPSDNDQIWVDTSVTPYVVRIHDGTEWIATGGYVVMTNKSGAQRTLGDVCIISTTNSGAFTTTTTQCNPSMAVVVMETIDDNADGVVATSGGRVTNLKMEAAVNPGDWIALASTAANGIKSINNSFAVALATLTGAGTLSEALIVGTRSPNSAVRSSFRNLKVVRTNATTVTVTADELVVQDDTNGAFGIRNVSVAPAITASGANGLDTGAEAANTIYYVWVIRKSSDGTVAGLLSTSSTAPTMPSGYDQKALVSAVGNNNSQDFIDFTQHGKEYWFTSWAAILSAYTTSTWTAIDLTPSNMSTVPGFVPSALSTVCRGSYYKQGNSGQYGGVSNISTLTTGGNNEPNKYVNGDGSDSHHMWELNVITADTIYGLGSASGSTTIYLSGFSLNLLG